MQEIAYGTIFENRPKMLIIRQIKILPIMRAWARISRMQSSCHIVASKGELCREAIGQNCVFNLSIDPPSKIRVITHTHTKGRRDGRTTHSPDQHKGFNLADGVSRLAQGYVPNDADITLGCVKKCLTIEWKSGSIEGLEVRQIK